MPTRKYSATTATTYRFGFNGKEKSSEIYGESNAYDFGARIQDPRLGRWFSADPLKQIYTSLSPYNFAANNPINLMDADGNILRDQHGNIIATYDAKIPPGEKMIGGNASRGVFIKTKIVTIYTDKGNPVQAEIVTGFVTRTTDANGKITEKAITGQVTIGDVKVNAESVKSNCHGYVFAEGELIIGDERSNILRDEYDNIGKPGNTQIEENADIAVVTIQGEDAEKKESSWYHTGKKQTNKKWKDKDNISPAEKDKLLDDISKYKGRLKDVALDINLYKRKSRNDKKVTATGTTDKNNSKIKIVSQATIDKIKKTLPEG
jgi:RHS repeat-associated protein